MDISRKNPTDYDLIQRVGSGTYGDVYKAKRISKNELAAIKIIKLDPLEDFRVIQQEIVMMKDCRHPNIVAFYGSYLSRDRLWICMEYCGGGSLQDIYLVTGSLPEPHIAFVCRETLNGLFYLHSMGRMHRDIKGPNILLTNEGDVKLADFGVSAQITATINKRQSLIGTPYWMAPEVAAVEKKGGYDQQCDIWALGITAIELAERQPPMYDLHPMRALFLMSKSSFKPPTLKDKHLWSQDFHNFIKSALTKNPKKRPSAEKLLTHQFVQGDHLNRRLTKELIDKARNPHSFDMHLHNDLDPDEVEEIVSVPRRIPSKKPPSALNASRFNRPLSEIKTDGIVFRQTEWDDYAAESPSKFPASDESYIGLSEEDHDRKSLLEEMDEELTQRGVKTSLTALYSTQSTLPVESLQRTSSNQLSHPGSDRSNHSVLFGRRGKETNEGLLDTEGYGSSTFVLGSLRTDFTTTNTSSNNNYVSQFISNYETPRFDKDALIRWNNDTLENLLDEICSERADNTNNTDFEEFSTPPSTPKTLNGSPPDSPSSLNSFVNPSSSTPSTANGSNSRSDDHQPTISTRLSNGNHSESKRQSISSSSELASANQPPSAPPRRKDKRLLTKLNSSQQSSQQQAQPSPRQTINGLPPTPKVHMGACFSKVFNECPLMIHCSASWIHPETRDQHILLGCEEGIYTLNLNQLHDACIDQLYPRRTTWMFVIKDVLMSLSGKTSHLYRHDLVALHSKNSHRFSLPMDSMINKIPERFVPWKLTATSKISDTRGCTKCCVARNPYNGYKYLCGVNPNGIFLMQWYNPLNKFMFLKQFEFYLPSKLDVFEMMITPDLEYPMLCVGVKRGYDDNYLRLEIVNLNSSASWFNDDFNDGTETIIHKYDQLNIVNVTQLDKETILVCHDNNVKLVNLDGKLKCNRKQPAELQFDFKIESIVSLTDCVLAFHKHGMQGRSFKNAEIVQEINDESRCFRLLGADRVIALESRSPSDQPNAPSNLYILAGHEASY
ncbi:mitogen-activated protein kinase kinase kinase kinase 5-like isoform X2 [Panonychus citri]|uniref:mitogen-activated protein kinase kinase kinase kinase 5-like isoform X2 n=1 Tax=Panonychus citri TaxID=50023 RepID=UPI002307C1FF|nr:mitogen-activated protein kinase kinase kinase kinase 5-like isoform X2 [Panonychus citri]